MRPLLPLALMLVGCTTPTESSVPCGPCAAPGAMPPSAEAVQREWEIGRAAALKTCPAVATRAVRPALVWWECNTWVAGAVTEPGGRAHGVCAKGMTEENGSAIHVSLAAPNVLTTPSEMGVTAWEYRNAAWITSGCGGQAL